MRVNRQVKVRIEDMTKVYGNGDGVNHIDLDIYEGEFLTLLGPSGCGKTTILRVLGGFIEVNGGNIYIDERDVTHQSPEKRETSMVFQSYNLWPHMSVYENLAFGLKLRKVNKEDIKRKITDMLEMVNMSGVEEKYPGQLSGGQQQRIAIARSLLLEPSVLLLDEPFSALDARIRLQMREELKRIQRKLNITVVFVTHDQEEAMSMSHRIVVMDKGKIAQIGTPEEIYRNPSSKYVASFIGNMNFIDQNEGSLAIRPEDVLIQEEGQYQGTITSVMPIGYYSIITMNTNLGDIVSYQMKSNLTSYQEGQTVRFNFIETKTFKENQS